MSMLGKTDASITSTEMGTDLFSQSQDPGTVKSTLTKRRLFSAKH